MNIDGFSEKTAELLFDKFGVENYSDVYTLDKTAVRNLDGYKDAKTENLFDAIEKSKEVSFSNFIFALGIDNVGKKTAKDFTKKFADINELICADKETLLSIEEVGEIIADCVVTYFSTPENVDEINKLLDCGVNIIYDKKTAGGVFSGEKVVLTGTLNNFKRDQAAAIIESLGGEIQGSVSKKTTLVVAGENAGSKLDKARALGVKIIDEETFNQALQERSSKVFADTEKNFKIQYYHYHSRFNDYVLEKYPDLFPQEVHDFVNRLEEKLDEELNSSEDW